LVVNSIQPAQPLVLTRDHHATLGELVEIMGLIENMLIQSAERVNPVAAQNIAKETAGRQGKLWADAVTGRVGDPQVAALLPSVEQQIGKLAEDRNDFIHALYMGDYAQGYMQPGYQTTSARRSKTGNIRSTCDLQSIRDRAATLSCLINRVAGAVR
jgi:hypothetical protein